jgi:uncharacterized protein YbbC (DUF1343 family)/CubicO group peptidase (beta-lactamase class C family)
MHFVLALVLAATTHAPIDAAIEQAIAAGKLPGGVIWIEHDGKVLHHRAYGHRALEPKREAMTKDTIFDAASLTKVVATAPSIWLLIERGKVGLDTPAKVYLPEIQSDAVTIRHLLTHTSGLRPNVDLREEWRGYDEGLRRALAETPRNRPGAVFRYSDINYTLLGEIVRRVSGEPLDAFARKNIFEPLGMRDTRFIPPKSSRIAPTENGLRGDVHDPTSRRMGGVAGQAGLFTTAADLAKFARAILAGDFFPRQMTEVVSPPEVSIRRAGGFDIDSHYARPRGEHFPIGTSFGHTGWTGGFIWIDPGSKSFYIFLSNRVHPDGKGSVVALQKELGTLVALAIKRDWPKQTPRIRFPVGGGDAQNGIDVLAASRYEALRGLRVGLITNMTGIDRIGNLTMDLLRSAPEVNLVALFSPEHGIRGTEDREDVGDDRISGLPIYSLYGERRKPSPEQLANLDALVFDIQDIGTRFYTYISTMGLAMEAAAEAKIRFIVLDRVNPIGGTIVEGPILEGPTDFVGWHPIPVRHGMTVGELAEKFKKERSIDVELTVIPVKGWPREQWQDEAGLPWINTSPNMRSLTAAGLYPGIGLVEYTVSVGRGTDTPFEILGAPYIDPQKLIDEVGPVAGITMTPITFTPAANPFKGEECRGVRFTITDRRALRSFDLGLAIVAALVRLYPQQFPVDTVQRLLRHRETLEMLRAGKANLAPR